MHSHRKNIPTMQVQWTQHPSGAHENITLTKTRSTKREFLNENVERVQQKQIIMSNYLF